MTDKITQQIKDRLGSEGSTGLVNAVAAVLAARNLMHWNPWDGYSMGNLDFNDDGEKWSNIVADAKVLYAAQLAQTVCSHCNAPKDGKQQDGERLGAIAFGVRSFFRALQAKTRRQ